VKVPRGVLYLGLASFTTDMAHEMLYPLLPLFFTETLGTGVLFLGLFEGISEAVASVMKYAGGRLSDRTGKREPFVLWGYLLANGVRPFIGLATAPWQALTIRALDRMGKGLRTSPRDAWMAGMAAEGDRGLVYGFHRAMDHAGAVAGPLLATIFLWAFPGRLRQLFLLSLAPGLAAAWFIFRASRIHPSEERAFPAAVREGGMSLPRPLRGYFTLLSFFTLGLASDAFLLLNLRRVGVPSVWIPALWAGLHVVKSSTSAAGGRLSDAVGRKAVILSGWVLYALFYAAFGGVESRGAVVVIFLSYGVFHGLTEGPEKALIADLSPAGRQGELFGIYHLIIGLGSLPASLLFGLIWKAAGPSAAFYTVSVIALLCASVLAGISLPEGGRGEG
jgi:MFS family permease